MNTTTRSRLTTLVLALAALAPLGAQETDKSADRPARAIETVAPQYPYLMRRAEAAAEVTVSFNVNAKGLVSEMKIVDSSNPEFVAATLDALKKWRFTPALKDGKPVDSRIVQTFTFNVRSESEGAAASTQVASSKSKR
jgi:TonB family protein